MAISNDITFGKIHPAIGIARLGNSRSEHFIGPEIPGVRASPEGGFKDRGDPVAGTPRRVKRQGARFRIFGYDREGRVREEITSQDATITWHVHVANHKAEWFEFHGPDGEKAPARAGRRNARIRDRSKLIIDPGERTLRGPDQRERHVGALRAADPEIEVELAESSTDADARLVFLGGFGRSESWKKEAVKNYANNNTWFDDTSDGTVRAEVTLNDGRAIPVSPAWVITGPPDFAPGIQNLVTLYDVVYEAALQRGFVRPDARVSFRTHIEPILRRAVALQWVSREGLRGHGISARADFSKGTNWAHLASSRPEHKAARMAVFDRLRDPTLALQDQRAVEQANKGYMPLLSGDQGDAEDHKPGTWLTLTRTQYKSLQLWADGEFDLEPEPRSATEITAEGLDRAALENCAGGAFFPGIEAGWILRRASVYSEAFRIDHKYFDEFQGGVIGPGEITKRSALPWQADFFECMNDWWPAQRPDHVMVMRVFDQIRVLDAELKQSDPRTIQYQVKLALRNQLRRRRALWARALPLDSPDGDNAMVENWYRLGFLSDRDNTGNIFESGGVPYLVEVDRDERL